MQKQSKYSQITRAHVFISGKVQGVGYRFSTLEIAVKIGVNGWVKNLPDGRVEAVFESNKEAIEKMINWCKKGPDYAIVKDISIEYQEPQAIKGFEIHRY